MRKEAKHLFQKAVDSLTISIELFNRPNDNGRVHGVLIFMDHAFEMLLKASIVERRGKILQDGKSETIGMSSCIRKCLSDAKVKFLSEEQVLVLQTLNSLRDAAQHYVVKVSEQQLYFHCQAGLTLFRDITNEVFRIDLRAKLPERVLPLSTIPPLEISALFDNEITEIKKLLSPKSRKLIEAKQKLRSLAIFENAVKGIDEQPSEKELKHMLVQIKQNLPFGSVFPSVSTLRFTANGYGPSLDLRITKDNDATPIIIVPEGTAGAAVVAIRRVNELDFYNLSAKDLSEKSGLSVVRMVALIKELKLQNDPDCYKLIVINSQKYKRYSQKALASVKKGIKELDMDDVWERNKPKAKKLN
ncbi:MAG TPA: hypothetical protein PLP18_06605 [Smithellaceae bacterium]|nr:hypothetical protein [Smithellaceae bacterium]HPE07306.1 hypothetical protein [Smithellaceae bacterium]